MINEAMFRLKSLNRLLRETADMARTKDPLR